MGGSIDNVVVVGAGHGGVEVAAALRQKGFAGSIKLISDEPDLPYQRPPLSKEYIKRPGNALVLKPAQFYADNHIDLLLGERATAIDPKAKSVVLGGGETLAYDHLVLAMGARNRKPPVPGLDHHDVIELRTLADANKIVGVIGGWKHVCVIGGGFIGLEAAGLLATVGVKVEVVEVAQRLMQRAVSPTVSAWFLDYHAAQGTRVHLETQVTAVKCGAGHAIVQLDNGGPIEANAVVLAAGVVPNTELAAAAGLRVDNGIVVDELLVSSDPAISAVGDCAHYPSPYLPGMTRLESVQNATDQGKAVAARIMGDAKPYDALPWFWSIQGEARLQIAGLSKQGLPEVVRGDPASGKFSVFLYEGERLAAVESVNAPGENMAARRLIAAGTKVDPSVAADTSIDMKSLIEPAPPS